MWTKHQYLHWHLRRLTWLTTALLYVGCAPASTENPPTTQALENTQRAPAGTAAAPNSEPVPPDTNTAQQAIPSGTIDASAAASTVAAFEPTRSPATNIVRRLVAREELILQLTPQLEPLTRDLLNLHFPLESRSQFQSSGVSWWDLASDWQTIDDAPATSTSAWTYYSINVTDAPQPLADDTRMWQSLLRELDYFEHAKFAIVSGDFRDDAWETFRTRVSFTALARRKSGTWLDVHADLDFEWQKQPAASTTNTDKSTSWRITAIRPLNLQLVESAARMFEEVLPQLVPDPTLRNRLRESQHWIYATRHYYPKRLARLPGEMTDARFFPISTAYHPALAVVDINADGWDDLYIVDRWGKNMLLRSQANGTFEECTAEYGLDIDGRSNAAVFADFDNDGDPDLILARSLERSMYLVN
ncbi:MAG: VCBS repeat-containing protein, partial [Planctomycetales bacterium]|nr:VCBS repeat-containing protein [Planctomycetales bacterium]